MTAVHKEARAHHYVPQCWLLGFTETGEKDGMLYVTDLKRKKQWRCKPSEVGHRRDFNRVDDPSVSDPNAIETIFAEVESSVATAKSVFLFDVQGSVAKSTFAGLPWLLYLRSWCKRPIHFWPFDGWEVPDGKSVVAEVYPALWMRRFERDGRGGDEHAAYATAAWLQRADRNHSLGIYFKPLLTPEEREVADIEGWILGVI